MKTHNTKDTGSDIIRVDDVSFSYGNEKILEDISVQIPKGSITAIIGPNGSGKTTLLKVLLGFLAPQKGSVRVFGKTTREIRRKVGYVPQRFEFDRTFPITVLEFLKMSHPKISEKNILESLAHLGMGESPHEQLGALSGGQLQRVLVVRAMLSKPELLYLDEPSAGIDIGGEHNFYQMVAHIHRDHGTTVILVSHEIDVVYGFVDQVICVNRELVCSGAPKVALTPEVLKTLYGKEASVYHHKEKQNQHTH